MTDEQWNVFLNFKESFKSKIEEWEQRIPDLIELQKKVSIQTKTPDYPLETSVVYNRDLDKITKESCIKLIVIGDNPGKDEKLSKNRRYPTIIVNSKTRAIRVPSAAPAIPSSGAPNLPKMLLCASSMIIKSNLPTEKGLSSVSM